MELTAGALKSVPVLYWHLKLQWLVERAFSGKVLFTSSLVIGHFFFFKLSLEYKSYSKAVTVPFIVEGPA